MRKNIPTTHNEYLSICMKTVIDEVKVFVQA